MFGPTLSNIDMNETILGFFKPFLDDCSVGNKRTNWDMMEFTDHFFKSRGGDFKLFFNQITILTWEKHPFNFFSNIFPYSYTYTIVHMLTLDNM